MGEHLLGFVEVFDLEAVLVKVRLALAQLFLHLGVLFLE